MYLMEFVCFVISQIEVNNRMDWEIAGCQNKKNNLVNEKHRCWYLPLMYILIDERQINAERDCNCKLKWPSLFIYIYIYIAGLSL